MLLPSTTAWPLPAQAPTGPEGGQGEEGPAGQGSGPWLGGDSGKAKEKTSPESHGPWQGQTANEETEAHLSPTPHQGFFRAPNSAGLSQQLTAPPRPLGPHLCRSLQLSSLSLPPEFLLSEAMSTAPVGLCMTKAGLSVSLPFLLPPPSLPSRAQSSSPLESEI